VAVIDSGVDPAVSALAGRVLAGADVTPGGRQGTGDCLGHGTAMAALVAARPGGDPEFTGMAPDATVLPIRVDLSGGWIPADQAADAIRVALAAKADVIMVAPHLRRVDGAVVAAIHAAEAQDAVVVLPAGSVEGSNISGGAVIRVGGVGVDGVGTDGKPAHRTAGVDVVAPGVDVSSLGPGGVGLVRGTGEDYATAFVAGLVALVRSVRPAAPAPQVVQMILSTADPMTVTESRDGSRFINPLAAAQLAADWPADRSAPPFALTGGAWSVILLILIVGLIVAGFGWRRRPAPAMYPGPRQEPDPGRAGIEICE
jgi:subtilisin family serine protease